jgi:Protein of unknown function (DUF2802)
LIESVNNYVSLGLSAIALIIALFALFKNFQQKKENEKLLRHMMRELSSSSSGAVGMGRRLMAMEKKLAAGATVNRQKIDYQDEETFKPYSEAVQLFKMGMTSEEVSKRCGLSRAEASLLEMMHKIN